MDKVDFVALDLGASGTRYVDKTNVVETMSNKMFYYTDMDPETEKTIPDLEPDSTPISDDAKEKNLEVIIKRTDEKEDKRFPIHAAIGDFADSIATEFKYPNSGADKSDQLVNYVSALTATALSSLQDSLSEDIKLYIVLPPSETIKKRDNFKNNIIGSYEVYFPRFSGNNKVNINIVDVNVYEESRMAIISAMFTFENNRVDLNKKYMSKFSGNNILSIDIGASTTDLCMLKDGKYIPKTGRTYPFGGNHVRHKLKEKLDQKGIHLSEEALRRAVIEGRYHDGYKYVECRKDLMEAKNATASRIIGELNGYFENLDMNIMDVQYILVSGGGSMPSQYVDDDNNEVRTSKSMGAYITEEIANLCASIEVVDHPLENARYANIYGLLIQIYNDIKHNQF